ncbi:hypothetical protein ACO0LG_08190 [Undibacterium sp. Ji42W]|uniref:hypothetical protein n=1 Tax=Undibacterium sp. Ji42W TaxID=3413039 RepID=UPI003BF1DF4C
MFYGTKFFGQVESVDRHLHIATRFHHFSLIPLVYQGSYIVIDNTHALRIPINFKSIAFAYLRLLIGAVIIVSILSMVIILSGSPIDRDAWWFVAACTGVIALSFTVAYYSFKFGKASAEKKAQMIAFIEKNKENIVKLGPMRVHAY